jgi:hypothetical protein
LISRDKTLGVVTEPPSVYHGLGVGFPVEPRERILSEGGKRQGRGTDHSAALGVEVKKHVWLYLQSATQLGDARVAEGINLFCSHLYLSSWQPSARPASRQQKPHV